MTPDGVVEVLKESLEHQRRMLGFAFHCWRRRRLEPRPANEAADPKVLEALRTHGIAVIPRAFDPAQILSLGEALERHLDSGKHVTRVSDDARRKPGERDASQCLLTREEIARGQASYRHRTLYVPIEQPLIACPDAVPLALDPRLIATASAYLNAPAGVSGVNLRKSFANDLPVFDTLYFHSDPNSPRFLKFFFYLNDVEDPSHGPFCYVRGSHRLKFAGWKRQYRFTADELRQHYPEDAFLAMTARVGDLVIADTTGFHCGLKAKTRDRRMLTVNYTAYPTGEPPMKISLASLSRLSDPQRASTGFMRPTAPQKDGSFDAPAAARVAAAEPVPAREHVELCLNDVLKSLREWMNRPSRRDRSRVQAEYEGDAWRTTLLQRRWETAASLSEFVVPPEPTPRIAVIDGRAVRVRTQDYSAHRLAKLTETLRRFAGDAPRLVELGSGAGMNLFSLALGAYWAELVGLEISRNGVEATRRAAARFGLESTLRAELHDLTDRGASSWKRLAGEVAFSYYCLEQLPYDIEQVLLNIVEARPRRVIHIENTYELLEPLDPGDLATRLHLLRMDYTRTLLSTLRRMQAAGLIRILAVERLRYAPTLKNDPTLICWEPLGWKAEPAPARTGPDTSLLRSMLLE